MVTQPATRDELQRHITSAIEHVRTSIRDGEPSIPDILQAQAIVSRCLSSETLSTIVQLLSSTYDVTRFDNKKQVLGTGSAKATLEGLAEWLVARALLVEPEEALDDLKNYLSNDSFRCIEVVALGGIEIEAEARLGSSIRVGPHSAIPDSPQKQWVTGTRSWLQNRPTAFLIRERLYPQIHRPLGTRDMSQWGLLQEFTNQFEEARLCLAVCGPAGPIALGEWISPGPEVPIGARGLGGGMAGAGPRAIRETRRLTANDLDVARLIYKAFLDLEGPMKRRMRLAMDRLVSSVQRENPVDRAIDMGIAAEVLTQRRGYLLALRIARLIETSPAKRRKEWEIAHHLYRARGDSVHDGKLKDTYLGVHHSEFLPQAAETLTRAIREFILKRGKVDWLQLEME